MTAIDQMLGEVGAGERSHFAFRFGDSCLPASAQRVFFGCYTGKSVACDDMILNDHPSGPGMKNEL